MPQLNCIRFYISKERRGSKNIYWTRMSPHIGSIWVTHKSFAKGTMWILNENWHRAMINVLYMCITELDTIKENMASTVNCNQWIWACFSDIYIGPNINEMNKTYGKILVNHLKFTVRWLTCWRCRTFRVNFKVAHILSNEGDPRWDPCLLHMGQMQIICFKR